MNVGVHAADAVVPDNVHVVNDPVTPVSLRAIVPVGVTNVPAAEVSVTVTVHVDPWLTITGVVHETVVVVVRSDAVVPAKVHVVKVPVTPVSVSATVPDGVMNVPAEVSATVTVQVEPWFTTTGVVQLTVVVVARLLTTMLAVPLLPV